MSAAAIEFQCRRGGTATLDVNKVRADFPILNRRVHGLPLVYLDNAATTQKPQTVIDAVAEYYASTNANIHRGVHLLSESATEAHESVRKTVQRFLNAEDPAEIVFVRGATEGINLVAASYGRTHVHAGDEVLITAMEHHSNIVPWQMLCEEKGARLRIAPINDDGELLMNEFSELLNARTRLVAVTHVSNVLGTVNPVAQLIHLAHRWKVPVLLDGAQAVPHCAVDVRALDCDFYVFSGHKVYGPTGIGVLYGKRGLLDTMPPYQGGGDMIRSVTFEKTIFNNLPYKFEAGTPNIAGAIGLGAALEYVAGIGIEAVSNYEHDLLVHATRALGSVPGVKLIGAAKEKSAVLSFVVEGVHPHDIGTVLDREGIAVRTGHHCAQPLMLRFGIPATVRASLAMYNTASEIDALVAGIQKLKEIFA